MRLFASDLMAFRSSLGGYCAAGSRTFAARHGLSWAKFVSEGIDAKDLLKTGDALAAAFVEWAERARQRKEESDDGQ